MRFRDTCTIGLLALVLGACAANDEAEADDTLTVVPAAPVDAAAGQPVDTAPQTTMDTTPRQTPAPPADTTDTTKTRNPLLDNPVKSDPQPPPRPPVVPNGPEK